MGSDRTVLCSLLAAELETRKAAAAMFFADVSPIPREGFFASSGFTGSWSSRKTSVSRPALASVRAQRSIIESNTAASPAVGDVGTTRRVANFADPKAFSQQLERHLCIVEVDNGLEKRFKGLNMGRELLRSKSLGAN